MIDSRILAGRAVLIRGACPRLYGAAEFDLLLGVEQRIPHDVAQEEPEAVQFAAAELSGLASDGPRLDIARTAVDEIARGN